MINVNKPFIPPLEEYLNLISTIWENNILTNQGPLLRKLNNDLSKYLNLENLLIVSNGTIALQIAIKALGLKGEIITTPYSYVATTSSIVWEDNIPVFVDINLDDFNLNPSLIESKITNKTSAILCTHVYGNPCSIEKIESIAKKYNLKVIYDAAHCFGVDYDGKSIFNYGDISTTSFHATKVFHMIEGGAIFCKDKELFANIRKMHNFGSAKPYEYSHVGINAKNSEFHAAMGILSLKWFEKIRDKRKKLYNYYLRNLEMVNILIPPNKFKNGHNYSYFPVLFDSEETCLRIIKKCEDEKIFLRRYFYPSLSKLPYVNKTSTPVSDDISRRVVCLPFYYDLNESEIDKVVRLIKTNI